MCKLCRNLRLTWCLRVAPATEGMRPPELHVTKGNERFELHINFYGETQRAVVRRGASPCMQ